LKKVTDIDYSDLTFEAALGELRNVQKPKEDTQSLGKGWSLSGLVRSSTSSWKDTPEMNRETPERADSDRTFNFEMEDCTDTPAWLTIPMGAAKAFFRHRLLVMAVFGVAVPGLVFAPFLEWELPAV
jgi:hypothetical protein